MMDKTLRVTLRAFCVLHTVLQSHLTTLTDTRASNRKAQYVTLMKYLSRHLQMKKNLLQIEQIREAHKALH